MSTVPAQPQAAELLVIGPPDRRAHLQQAMHELAPLLQGVDCLDDASSAITPATGAIIVLDDSEQSWADAVARLRRELGERHVPLVLVVDPGCPSEQVRAAYDAGATAVLQWPTEVLLVHELLLELLELPGEGRLHAATDVALTEAVAARLRLDVVLAHRASCRVVGNTAVVRAELTSLWERDRLVRLVEAVPGITHVVEHGVVVQPVRVPDDVLDDTVTWVVRSTGNVEARALEATVAAGVVTIAGRAAPETAMRVRNAVRAIPGVLRVHDVSTPDG